KKGQDLIDLIADTAVGQTARLGVVRDKKPMTLNVVIGDRSKIFAADFGNKPSVSNDNGPAGTTLRFGMTVEPLRAQDKQRSGYKGDGQVVIRSIESGSFAEDVGLLKGDIILQLNRQNVATPEDIRKIQANLKPGDSVVFHVMRQAPGPRGGGDWVSIFPAG